MSVIHVGVATSEVIIRKALAIGQTDAIRIDTQSQKIPMMSRNLNCTLCSKQSFDIVLLGKETIDHNGSEVGTLY